jgi:exodeoxyribonuclease VII small subunit
MPRPDTDHVAAESYEALVQVLEEIVNRLESDGLTLDDAVAAYEEGMQLVRQCNDLLDKAELRVTELSEDLRRSASDVEP